MRWRQSPPRATRGSSRRRRSKRWRASAACAGAWSGEARGTVVYDDFAHHPTAIRTTLEGLRAKVGSARILAILEPRSNTMRLGTMKERLAASLEIADRVYVFAADLGWDAEAALRPLGPRARSFSDLGGLVAAVVADARPGDHVLVMSNGSFGGVHGKLLQAFEGKAKA